jgi:hypothetical protein
MKFWINVLKGFHLTCKTAQMVLLLFVANLIFALVLAIPMVHSLKDSFGNSLVAERMAQGFDSLWWEEYRDQSKGLEKTFTPFIIGKGAILHNFEMLVQIKAFDLPPLIILFGLVYILLHTFLAGGLLSTFNRSPPRFAVRSFIEGAGHYFSRFVLVMLVSWLFFFGLVGSLNHWLNSIVGQVAEQAFSEITPFYLNLVFNAIIFFLLLLFRMIFDYARIAIVADKKKNILKAISTAFGFVFKNPGSTLSLFYTIFAVNFIVTLFYILISQFIPKTDTVGVLCAFVFQQLFMFAVVGIRCWLYASQMELYKYAPKDI